MNTPSLYDVIIVGAGASGLVCALQCARPCMVSLLKGDIYRTEYGSVYLGLTLTVLPLFVVYFLLSKYIIAGVALGSVKG